jgi:transcriptional regulator with XRE-family HTH domain
VIVDKREKSDPHPIDAYVGDRMRLRRIQLDLNQGALARKIGVSFQAVQKYESGNIRISASRLYEISQALEVPPAFFFDGYPDGVTVQNLTRDISPGIATGRPPRGQIAGPGILWDRRPAPASGDPAVDLKDRRSGSLTAVEQPVFPWEIFKCGRQFATSECLRPL